MGTDGARIERIRRLSSAKIKIFAPMEGEDSRIIWIEGSMQSIQMALFLLNCCRDLYSNNSSTGMNDPFAKRARRQLHHTARRLARSTEYQAGRSVGDHSVFLQSRTASSGENKSRGKKSR